MEKILKLISYFFFLGGAILYAFKFASFFQSETSDVSIINKNMDSTGLILILFGVLLNYQFLLTKLSKKLKDK